MEKIDIKSGIEKVLQAKNKQYPSHVNRISGLDDPCLRRLYYKRVDWDKATPHDTSLLGIFGTGNILEPVIERIVSEVGMADNVQWRIVGSQTPTNDALLKKYNISGTIDGFLQFNVDGVWITMGVIDIKTSSPYIYPNINSYADLARYSWTKKYRGQLQLYALAHNVEHYFILFVNKTNLYDMKMIDFPVDMEYCEGLLQKADTVNKAIDAGVAPDGVNTPSECTGCSFVSHCMPEVLNNKSGMHISTDEELEGMLSRMDTLKPAEKEYGQLKRGIDKKLIKGQNTACGKYLILWEQKEKNFKAVEAKDARVELQWKKEIVLG